MTSLADLTATTPGLPCRTTDPELWFSKSSTDRAAAIALCQECPIRQACAQYALDDRSLKGIWGGTTAADRRQFWTGEQCRLDGQGRIRLECGSEKAYRAHFSYREQPCVECRAAHDAVVEAERRAQLEQEHAKGGTSRGYFIHRRLGEVACAACRSGQGREAKARRERGRAAGDRAREAWDAQKGADALRGAQAAVQRLALAG
jgi:hypothetical protein